MTTERRDVAIYSPGSWVYFERSGLEEDPHGGGAELQMAVLAEALAEAKLKTAVILWPAKGSELKRQKGLDLIERPAYGGDGRGGSIREAFHIWRSMSAADARAYIFRGSSARLLVGALFCRLRRRRLVFSAANDLDFEFERGDRSRLGLWLYRAALRRADLIVAQSEHQLDQARAAGLDSLELIPSFAAPAPATSEAREAFLWIGRMVDYKRPLAFMRLAEALPDIRFRMICFALDETRPELPAEIERAARSLPNLELIGLLPRPEVLEMIGRAFAVVSTSATEGMPNIFLEAWARGVPVISLDYDPDGKLEELGIGLVAAGSEQRMSEQAESVWRDEGLRRQLGERGREYVLAVHSPAAVSALWAQTLITLVGA